MSQAIKMMPRITWDKQDRRYIIIPEQCEIIIPAEYNKFYIEGENGFKLFHCDFGWGYNYIVFLWKGCKANIEIEDKTNLLSNKRMPLIDERLLITYISSEYDKAYIKIEKYENQPQIGETIILEKEKANLTWNGKAMKIPEECKITIPVEYNCIYDSTNLYIRLIRYDDEDGEKGALLFWTVPIKRKLIEVKNRSQAFDVTEVDPLMPCFLLKKGRFKIDSEEIIAIELTINFELTEKQKLFRRLSFSPIEKAKDWWTETNLLIK